MPGPARPLLNSGSFFLLACSPRPGGNSDLAANAFARGFAGGEPQGVVRDVPGRADSASAILFQELRPTYLRSYRITPCVSCGACTSAAAKHPPAGKLRSSESGEFSAPQTAKAHLPAFGCPLTTGDDSAVLLHALCRAKSLCLVSPIYFYHLPAALKGLIDRTQPFWSLREEGDTRFYGQPPRVCRTILLAARSKGQKLFEGSMLTLKHAFAALNIHMAEPLLLYGIDKPGEFADQPEAVRAVEAYGEEAGRQA